MVRDRQDQDQLVTFFIVGLESLQVFHDLSACMVRDRQDQDELVTFFIVGLESLQGNAGLP
jgi:hypothetical protein